MTLPGGDLVIEWRESDDHVLMTGAVEYEYRRPLRSGAVCAAQPSQAPHERRCRHLRLPARTPMSPRSCAHEAEKRGSGRCGRGQYLRGDGGSGAAGAPDHPQASPREPRCAHRRHRLRRADRAGDLSPPCRKSIACSAIPRSSMPRPGAISRTIAARTIRVDDIMAARNASLAPVDGDRGPHARLRADPEWLRSSLHLLHHPVWARQFALGADGRDRRASAPAGRERLSRNRADRRRHHELWRDLPGAPKLGALVEAILAAGAGAQAAAALVDRFGRGRCRSARCARRARRG